MGQVGQSEIRKDCFGNVDHRVATVVPRGKDTDLGIPLRIDRAIQESSPWMPAAGIGQDAKFWRLGLCLPIHRKYSIDRRGRFVNRHPGRQTDFVGSQPMVQNHILEPMVSIGLAR